MPPVSDRQPDLHAVKPGATVAAVRRPTTGGRSRSCSRISATAAARRSRCRFRTRGSWQMDATMPVEDTTHETFWRRLLRWLVDGVPDSVERDDDAGSRRAGRSGEADRRRRRLGVRRSERRRVVAHGDLAVRQDERRAAGVDGRARRRVPRRASCPTSRASTRSSVSARRAATKTLGTQRHARARVGRRRRVLRRARCARRC